MNYLRVRRRSADLVIVGYVAVSAVASVIRPTAGGPIFVTDNTGEVWELLGMTVAEALTLIGATVLNP